MSSYKINSLGNLELKSRNGSILHKSAVEHEQAVTFSHADDAHLASLKSLSLANEDLLMHNGTSLNKVSKNDLLSGLASESYVDSAVAGVAPLITSVDLPLSVNSGVLSVELGDLLSQSLAESTYLSQADASTTYLSQADAQTTYLAQADQFITSIVEPSQLSVVDGVLNVNLDDYVSSSSLSTTLNDYATTAFVGTEVETAVDGLASISYVDDQIANVSGGSSYITSVSDNLSVTAGELSLVDVVLQNGDARVRRLALVDKLNPTSVYGNYVEMMRVENGTPTNKTIGATSYVCLEVPYESDAGSGAFAYIQVHGKVDLGIFGSWVTGGYERKAYLQVAEIPSEIPDYITESYSGDTQISDMVSVAFETKKLLVLINKLHWASGSLMVKCELFNF